MCLLLIMLIICIVIIADQTKQIRLQVDTYGDLALVLSADSEQQTLYPWHNEKDGKYYFFLPSFCNTDRIYVDKIEQNKVAFDGDWAKKGDFFSFQENVPYLFEIADIDQKRSYEICFMRSKNLPAVFIKTDSGSMDYLHENKNNEEGGRICVIRDGGSVEYKGLLQKISGRGNTTWSDYNKKSYSVTLHEKRALCGMDEGKNWNLLAICSEGARMGTKLVMDMAKNIELDYAITNDWIDLYLNGEYAGNYLFSETVSVSSGGVNIYDLEKENRLQNPEIDAIAVFEEDNRKGYSLENVTTVKGGFLIEKDSASYYPEEPAAFITEHGACFSIKSPQHASKEQVTYISEFIQKVEDIIATGNKEYLQCIDLESFTKRFVIDEIALDADANVTSMFFYLDKESDVLHAGPVWDYDKAMGECNSGWVEGHCVDYEWSTVYPFRPGALDWDMILYEQPEFYENMRDNFQKLLPFISYLLEEGIDKYAEIVQCSAAMDSTRWGNEDFSDDYPGNYQTFDNNVRYLKYYLENRTNYLMDRWDVSYDLPEFEGNGMQHTVSFVADNVVIDTQIIPDGEELETVPEYDEEEYWGWYYTYSKEKHRQHLPVLEDCTFYLREKD